MFRTWALLLLIALAGCGKKPAPVVKPHGASMVTLPVVRGHRPFVPKDGHYVELVQRPGHWQAFIDEAPAGTLDEEKHVREFLEKYKRRIEMKGSEATVLISAAGSSSLAEVKPAILGAAAVGIVWIEMQVVPDDDGSTNSEIHSALLDLRCCHDLWYRTDLPLTIKLWNDGAVSRLEEGAWKILDTASTSHDLPGLCQVLEAELQKEVSGDCERIVSVKTKIESLSYQRFVSVMMAIESRGLKPVFLDEPDVAESQPPQEADPESRPMPPPIRGE